MERVQRLRRAPEGEQGFPQREEAGGLGLGVLELTTEGERPRVEVERAGVVALLVGEGAEVVQRPRFAEPVAGLAEELEADVVVPGRLVNVVV